MSNELVAFTYQGHEVTKNASGFVNLTQMWKATGSPASKDPRFWMRLPNAIGFIENLARNLNVGKSHVMETRRGKGVAGTWAHWQVALAYAKYLSHDFHLYVNEAFREWSEEANDPDLKASRAIAGYRRKGRTGPWIQKRLEGLVVRNEFTSTLQEHEVRGIGFAACTDSINRPILGATAKEVRVRAGLPAKAPLRDNLPMSRLIALSLAETMATEEIERDDARGNAECAAVCDRAGQAVRKALEFMKSSR